MLSIKKILSFLWDSWCTLSILGIWPRFIEPKLLKKTQLTLSIPDLPNDLEGLKIAHFSDLHFQSSTSPRFLRKIQRKIIREKPDLILFSGDFICYSRLEEKERLQTFLNSFSAPYGCFCIFGNHDYASYVTLNTKGDFDVAKRSSLFKGIRLLLRKTPKEGVPTKNALDVPFHEDLCALIKKTPFQLLENTSRFIPIKASGINICGLGDLWLGRCRPQLAFVDYQQHYPGIIMAHNPDSHRLLKDSPGEIILSGHTHGEQIHFPGFLGKFSKRMAGLPKDALSRGLYNRKGKKIYVTKGVGCHKPFRFCSIPEFCLIRLKNGL